MKAIVCTAYGSPDVLQLKDIEKPVPKEAEVLVKVHASSLNFGDLVLVRGKPWITRLMGYGLFRPKNRIPGGDIAGKVEAVGQAVTQFQPGDEVFADIGGCGFGAYAGYVAVPAKALTLKPRNLSFKEAASVPQAAVVALQGLRDNGKI